jgi:hypothetical protein
MPPASRISNSLTLRPFFTFVPTQPRPPLSGAKWPSVIVFLLFDELGTDPIHPVVPTSEMVPIANFSNYNMTYMILNLITYSNI